MTTATADIETAIDAIECVTCPAYFIPDECCTPFCPDCLARAEKDFPSLLAAWNMFADAEFERSVHLECCPEESRENCERLQWLDAEIERLCDVYQKEMLIA